MSLQHTGHIHQYVFWCLGALPHQRGMLWEQVGAGETNLRPTLHDAIHFKALHTQKLLVLTVLVLCKWATWTIHTILHIYHLCNCAGGRWNYAKTSTPKKWKLKYGKRPAFWAQIWALAIEPVKNWVSIHFQCKFFLHEIMSWEVPFTPGFAENIVCERKYLLTWKSLSSWGGKWWYTLAHFFDQLRQTCRLVDAVFPLTSCLPLSSQKSPLLRFQKSKPS